QGGEARRSKSGALRSSLHPMPPSQGQSRRYPQTACPSPAETSNFSCRNSSQRIAVVCLPGSLRRDIVCSQEIVLNQTISPPPARQIALQILHTLETQHAYTDVVLREVLRHSTLKRRDRALITDCVYGVIRWQGKIDWLLGHVCRRPLDTLT